MGSVDLAFPCFFMSGLAAVTLALTWKYVAELNKVAKPGAKPGGKGGITKPRSWKPWLCINAVASGISYVHHRLLAAGPPTRKEAQDLDMNQNAIGFTFGASGLMIAVAQFSLRADAEED